MADDEEACFGCGEFGCDGHCGEGDDPRDVPDDLTRKVLYTLDLAKAHIEVGDKDLAAKNLSACLYALAALTDKTPESIVQDLVTHVPDDSEWCDVILPDLLGRNDG